MALWMLHVASIDEVGCKARAWRAVLKRRAAVKRGIALQTSVAPMLPRGTPSSLSSRYDEGAR